jgi:hypothetical protein
MKVHKQKHNPALVAAFFRSYGIPDPEFEYRFHETRKWRFDIAWPTQPEQNSIRKDYGGVYLEVQGGIWMGGGHNRGAQMKKDWEKYNTATEMGWRPLFVEPCDLLKRETAEMIRRALCLQ